MIKTLYLGPLVPRAALGVLRRRKLPVLPLPAGLRLQFVHADDVGDAVIRLLSSRVHGSFNVAADVLDSTALAALVGGRPIPLRRSIFRSVVVALHMLGVVALTPGWYDVAFNTPVMDTTKIRHTVGWSPARSATDSARELIDGLADGAVGASAAMGYQVPRPPLTQGGIDELHDVTLNLWTALALLRAIRHSRPGAVDAAVVMANLAAGTPKAADRVLQRRRDAVALLAPLAVVAALVCTRRGGWPAVAATGVLHVLNRSEHGRRGRDGSS
jgi:hypothetical protein